MSKMKSEAAKAAELLNKMMAHQHSTGGETGGNEASRRAVESAIVVADEMISHLDVDGIGYYGRYWRGVKSELNKYLK
jgi:ABC-type glutathione transport system ATPase component